MSDIPVWRTKIEDTLSSLRLGLSVSCVNGKLNSDQARTTLADTGL